MTYFLNSLTLQVQMFFKTQNEFLLRPILHIYSPIPLIHGPHLQPWAADFIFSLAIWSGEIRLQNCIHCLLLMTLYILKKHFQALSYYSVRIVFENLASAEARLMDFEGVSLVFFFYFVAVWLIGYISHFWLNQSSPTLLASSNFFNKLRLFLLFTKFLCINLLILSFLEFFIHNKIHIVSGIRRDICQYLNNKLNPYN